MNIPQFFKNMANVQFMRARFVAQKTQFSAQKGRITKLSNQVKRLQHLIKDDILSLTAKTTTYKGNEYQTYSTAVKEIDAKYNGTADWGVLQTGNIIDLRAAFIINEGPTIVKRGKKEADAEMEFAQKFLEYNDLDKEVAQDYAKEAEIEGKLAIKLTPETIKTKNKDGKETDGMMISAIITRSI